MAHVFVVYSDIRRLSCDGWAMPTIRPIVDGRNGWFAVPPALCAAAHRGRHTIHKLSDRVARIEFRGYEGPQPYQVVIAPEHFRGPRQELHALCVEEFVIAAAMDLQSRGVKPRNGRSKLLIATPILGTGGGGSHSSAGDVLKDAFPRVVAAAQRLGIDVAIVTNQADAYAAAQAQRRMHGYQWPLSPTLLGQANLLAKYARHEKLVLFIGAGASVTAGLPTWAKLLDALATQVDIGPQAPEHVTAALSGALASPPQTSPSVSTPGFVSSPLVTPDPLLSSPCAASPVMPSSTVSSPPPGASISAAKRQLKTYERERKEFESLSLLDRARIVESRLVRTGKSLGPAVAECLTSDFHSVGHSLLATMPCDEAVTTNYDRLFEQASDCCDPGTLSVLPMNPRSHAPRWLLKMHGCVSQPEDIVLTRKDYIRYAETSAALGGIVQALMMTKHMLFVGFSLQDDNFHRLFDSVQRARRPAAASGRSSSLSRSNRGLGPVTDKLGTVVCLEANTLQRELWGEHLDFVFMDGSVKISPPSAKASVAATMDSDEDVSVASPNMSELSRQQEIFLDYLSSQCNRLETHNLLNPRFAAQLTAEDLALHDALKSFMRDLPPLAQKSSGFTAVERMLEDLGGKKEFVRSVVMAKMKDGIKSDIVKKNQMPKGFGPPEKGDHHDSEAVDMPIPDAE